MLLIRLVGFFTQTCDEFFSIAEEKVSDVVPSGVLDCFQSPRTPSVQSYPKINGRVSIHFFLCGEVLVLLVVLIKASFTIIITLFHTVCSVDMKAPTSSKNLVVTVVNY